MAADAAADESPDPPLSPPPPPKPQEEVQNHPELPRQEPQPQQEPEPEPQPERQPQPEPQPPQQDQKPILADRLSPKCQLAAYTQRNHLQFPVYQTINEDLVSPAPRKFRCSVIVEGVTYASSNTFGNVKAAEQDAAKYAMEGIRMRLREEGRRFVSKDKLFCKSILTEFAAKMNMKPPLYTTKMLEGLVPMFISSLVFNDLVYTGEVSRNKREAEQSAARVVILSILDGSEILLSEMIKSKAKIHVLMEKSKAPQPVASTLSVVSNSMSEIVRSTADYIEVTEHNEVDNPRGNTSMEVACVEISNNSANDMNVDEFIKKKGEPTSEATDQLITTIPSVSVQPSMGDLRSEKKRNRRNKRKANKRARMHIQVPMNFDPPWNVPRLNQDPVCTVPLVNQEPACTMPTSNKVKVSHCPLCI